MGEIRSMQRRTAKALLGRAALLAVLLTVAVSGVAQARLWVDPMLGIVPFYASDSSDRLGVGSIGPGAQQRDCAGIPRPDVLGETFLADPVFDRFNWA